MTRSNAVNRSLIALLLASLLSWTAGNGLFPLLPGYAIERGATVAGAGLVLAAGFIGLAAGSLAANRLARAAGSRKWAYLGASLLQALCYALMGWAASVWHLLALLAAAWLCAGVTTTLAQVIAGLGADARRRGRVFGLLMLTIPLGALVGASSLGALVMLAGYRATFAAAGLLALGAALVAGAGLPADVCRGTPAAGRAPAAEPGRAYAAIQALLLCGALLASVALFFGRLATPVLMRSLMFNPQAIAGSAAVGGLVTAPFVLLVGELSDRLGRRRLLGGMYLLIALGVGLLAAAGELWQFYLAAALLSLGSSAGTSVAAALAGDLLPASALAPTLARLSAASWAAAVLAFAGGGYLLDRVAAPALCLGVALLALGAAGAPGLLHKLQRPEPALATALPDHTRAR